MIIRSASENDLAEMVSLSDAKRTAYEKTNPHFWRKSDNANKIQLTWFMELLSKPDTFMFVAEDHSKILGFIIGQNIVPPEVYGNRGLTLMIDDFCVSSPELWSTIGVRLLDSITLKGKDHGACQVLAVCGAHDQDKKLFIESQHLLVVSEWFVKTI